MNELEHELRKVVDGEVRFDAYSRLLNSTDASMYQVEPVGVVVPGHKGDVQAVLEVANRTNTPVLPRGGGTSLTGQAVYRAVVLDFSPRMNWLLEVNELSADRPLNMARVVVGSEGTLLMIVEAKVRLVRRPKQTALCVIHYQDLQEALESSQAILETGPYAVELTDKMILDLARGNIEQAQRMSFVEGDPAAILIVEYAGDDERAVREKIEALGARRARERFGYAAHLAFDPSEQQSIWKLRKAGLGLLLGMKGDKKPIAFVEDTAVDPKHLPEFVARFRGVLARHDARGAYYGHCSVGCLHVRPVIDLKTPRGLEQVRAI